MSHTTIHPVVHSLPGRVLHRAAAHARRIWCALEREYRIRQTLRRLECLDDRMLRDIGVHRGDLEDSVRRRRFPGRLR